MAAAWLSGDFCCLLSALSSFGLARSLERRTFTGKACEAALRNFGCRCYGRGNQHAQKMDGAVGESFGGRKPAGQTRGGGWASAGDQAEIS